jgi:hypothetical protein
MRPANTCELDAVGSRQSDVGQHDVGLKVRDDIKRLPAVSALAADD